ncbi:MAG TPA: SPFH domain-containing protein [Chryseolinea sp.]
MKMVTNSIKSIAAKVIVGILLTIFAFSTTKVNEHEIVVIYRWGQLVSGPVTPGLHFYLPFMHTIERYDASRDQLTIADLLGTDGKEDLGVNVESTDDFQAKVLGYVQYELDKSKDTERDVNPSTKVLVSTYGPKGGEEADKKIQRAIKDKVRQAIRTVFSLYTMKAAIDSAIVIEKLVNDFLKESDTTSTKGRLKSIIRYRTGRLLGETGIIIENVSIKIDPTSMYRESVNKKIGTLMETEKLKLEQEGREKIADLEKRAHTIAMENLRMKFEQEALIAKIENLKTQETNRREIIDEFLKKWNGILPQTLVTSQNDLRLLLTDKK